MHRFSYPKNINEDLGPKNYLETYYHLPPASTAVGLGTLVVPAYSLRVLGNLKGISPNSLQSSNR